ncbi:MAG: hypothetical protein ACLPTZ_13660, partial [Beijerinckiaceae bacterium]
MKMGKIEGEGQLGESPLSMNTAADCHPRESEDPGATRTKLWIPGLRLRLAGNDRGERLTM